MISFSYIEEQRKSAAEWARGLMALPADQWVILDTETTGLHSNDQIVQIAVVDGAGNTLVNNQLIRPTCDMSAEAEGVHGISMEMLKDAPSIVDFLPTLNAALKDKMVVIYNADFDLRMLTQSLYAFGAAEFSRLSDFKWKCAMRQYARFVGEWNERRGQFRWHKLPAHSDAHNALSDCLAVYEIIQTMAKEST